MSLWTTEHVGNRHQANFVFNYNNDVIGCVTRNSSIEVTIRKCLFLIQFHQIVCIQPDHLVTEQVKLSFIFEHLQKEQMFNQVFASRLQIRKKYSTQKEKNK